MDKDLKKYIAQWEKAEKENLYGSDAETPKRKSSGFFSEFGGGDDKAELDQEEYNHWRKLYNYSNKDYSDDLIQENVKDQPANPVDATTVGKDTDIILPKFTGGPELEKLIKLKIKLQEVESRLNALEAEGKNSKNSESQINDLKNQIDKVSNSLAPNAFEPQ